MNFLGHLLARARGDLPTLRPRRRTAMEAPAHPVEPWSDDTRTTDVAPASPRTKRIEEPFRRHDSPADADSSAVPRGRTAPGRGDIDPDVGGDAGRSSTGETHGAEPVSVTGRGKIPDRATIVARPRPAVEPPATPTSIGVPEHVGVRADEADRPPHRADTTGDAAQLVERGMVAPPRRAIPAADIRVAPREAGAVRRTRDEVNASSETDSPTIRIHIGRIDVRAEHDPPASKSVRQPVAPRLTLDDYARQRSRGER